MAEAGRSCKPIAGIFISSGKTLGSFFARELMSHCNLVKDS